MEEEKLIWHTKKFQEAKNKAMSEGKIKSKCEWCKSNEGLTPHHQFSFNYYKLHFLREVAITTMAEERKFIFTNSAIFNRGGFSINKGKGYIKIQELRAYVREHPEFYEKAVSKAKEKYFEFEDIITLCKRCHFAFEKGLELCPYCKKNYFLPKYLSCYKCKDIAEAEMENEMEKFEKEEDKMFEEMDKEFNSLNS